MTLPAARHAAPQLGPLACPACGIGAGCDALLRRAASDLDEDAAPALEAVVEAWWPVVFAMARRSGFSTADAEDVTQAYFARFLEKGYVRDAAQWGGCFRPFLYTTARHFFSNQRDHDRALKRGGGFWHVSLGGATDAERAAPEPQDPSTPETLLREDQSRSVAEEACRALALEMQSSGHSARFDRVARYLVGDVPRGIYRSLAEEWGVGEPAVRAFVYRLRRRLRARLSGLSSL
jgi:DNA-directed RNA polymerase specialized sigma24 family protein